MTLLEERPEQVEEPERRLINVIPGPKNKGILTYLTSTDHKQIGINYMVTSFTMFLIAGAMADPHAGPVGRAQQQFREPRRPTTSCSPIHGRIMMFLFLGPFAFGTGQLSGAHADRRARHGLPPAQCLFLLALPGWVRHCSRAS